MLVDMTKTHVRVREIASRWNTTYPTAVQRLLRDGVRVEDYGKHLVVRRADLEAYAKTADWMQPGYVNVYAQAQKGRWASRARRAA